MEKGKNQRFKVLGRYVDANDARKVIGYVIIDVQTQKKAALAVSDLTVLVRRGQVYNVAAVRVGDEYRISGTNGFKLSELPTQKWGQKQQTVTSAKPQASVKENTPVESFVAFTKESLDYLDKVMQTTMEKMCNKPDTVAGQEWAGLFEVGEPEAAGLPVVEAAYESIAVALHFRQICDGSIGIRITPAKSDYTLERYVLDKAYSSRRPGYMDNDYDLDAHNIGYYIHKAADTLAKAGGNIEKLKESTASKQQADALEDYVRVVLCKTREELIKLCNVPIVAGLRLVGMKYEPCADGCVLAIYDVSADDDPLIHINVYGTFKNTQGGIKYQVYVSHGEYEKAYSKSFELPFRNGSGDCSTESSKVIAKEVAEAIKNEVKRTVAWQKRTHDSIAAAQEERQRREQAFTQAVAKEVAKETVNKPRKGVLGLFDRF